MWQKVTQESSSHPSSRTTMFYSKILLTRQTIVKLFLPFPAVVPDSLFTFYRSLVGSTSLSPASVHHLHILYLKPELIFTHHPEVQQYFTCYTLMRSALPLHANNEEWKHLEVTRRLKILGKFESVFPHPLTRFSFLDLQLSSAHPQTCIALSFSHCHPEPPRLLSHSLTALKSRRSLSSLSVPTAAILCCCSFIPFSL